MLGCLASLAFHDWFCRLATGGRSARGSGRNHDWHDGPIMLYKVVLAFDPRSLQIIGVGTAPTAMDAMERRAPRPKM